MTTEQIIIAILVGTSPGMLIAISEILKPADRDVVDSIILYIFPVLWLATLLVNLPKFIKGL